MSYQKFVGFELELAAPSCWQRPVIMDATVPQLDGFRFIYILPFTERRILVEDTVFSESPTLDQGAFRQRLWRFLEARGVEGARLIREEHGVLDMPWRRVTVLGTDGPLQGGVRGGWFHRPNFIGVTGDGALVDADRGLGRLVIVTAVRATAPHKAVGVDSTFARLVIRGGGELLQERADSWYRSTEKAGVFDVGSR